MREEIEIGEYRFEDDGGIPNNPTLPLLVYPRALVGPEIDPSRCKTLLTKNGWGGSWVDGVFPYHHYHSTSHEVLCVIGGSASIAFGGPQGETIEVSAGDVVVIPAGVGHCNRGSDGRFSVVGAYPPRAGELRSAYRRRGRASRGAREHRHRRPAGIRPAVRRRGSAR
jgi:uncharacterized protein YjlB